MIGKVSADIEQYLIDQERFEDLRQKTIFKAGRNLCDLSYANSYDGPGPEVLNVIRQCLGSDRTLDMQYTPYGGSTITRRLIARQLSRTHGERFNWRNIVLTPGAMAALNVLFRAIRHDTEPNEVVVITPCWLDYPLYLANLGITPVMVPMTEDLTNLDLERIKHALGPYTRAVVLSQPNNPLGTLYTPDQLQEFSRVLEASETQPLLMSDECHRDVVFEPHRFSSPMKFYDNTCVVYSFGKSLFIQGQRIGYAAISPRMTDHEKIARQLERLCRTMGFCTPTALMQLAVRHLLDTKPDLGRIVCRRKRMLTALESSGYEVIPSQATFFLYVRCPDEDDFAFAESLADHFVLVLPSSIFHQRSYFRLSFTASDEMVGRALPVFQTIREKYPSHIKEYDQ